MEHAIIEKMLLIRRVEEEIIARYPKQLMRCPVHLSNHQEAVAVGVCHHLTASDSVFSTHRCHAAYLAKGGSLDRMALEIHGKVGGCMDGRGGSMHLMDTSVNIMSIPIVASSIPLAVGVALANKIDGNGNVVVCFFGDAAVEEGVFHESMNFASLMQLPIIFVCENNGYSVDTPISKRQPDRDFQSIAEAHNISTPHSEFSGQDVFFIEQQFKSIIDETRKNIPQFIIFNTQRSHVHCGIDKEFDLTIDPLTVVERHVIDGGIMSADEYLFMDIDVRRKIMHAFDAAEAAPLPTPEMAKEHVYA